MAKLSGRVALVTGAGRGIGRELALLLAAEGARVVVNDLDPEPAEETAAAARAAGAEAVAMPGSITRADFPNELVGGTLDRFGDLHILVNNAGYVWNDRLHKTSDEQWDAMQAVHLKAPFQILRAAYEPLRSLASREAESGQRVQRKVVNISSISGTHGAAGQAAYSAAKAGVVGLTRTLAREWGRLQVNVNCVAFGLIDTRLTQEIKGETSIEIEGRRHRVGLLKAGIEAAKQSIPLGRTGSCREAAGGVLLLCLPESDYITGQLLEVDGGLAL